MSEDKIREENEMTEEDWESLVNHYWDVTQSIIDYMVEVTTDMNALNAVLDIINEKEEVEKLTAGARKYIEDRSNSELGGH